MSFLLAVIGLCIPIAIAVSLDSWLAFWLVVWANLGGYFEGMYVKKSK